MAGMDRYIPTEEERLLSLLGATDTQGFMVSADCVLEALGIETFRLDGLPGVVVKPAKSPYQRMFDESYLRDCRPATKDETQLHEISVHDYHLQEAIAGIL
jgi:hypothetical protein